MMKFNPGSAVSALLVVSLVTAPLQGAFAAERTAPRNIKHLAVVMLDEMTANSAKMLAKVDTKIINKVDAEKTSAAKKEIAKQIARTKTSAAEVEKLRNEARTNAVKEAKRSKAELLKRLNSASTETLDRYAAEMKFNASYATQRQAYAAAYTRTEKARIIQSVVTQDLDNVLSMTLKRLNWLNADGLRADLKSMESRVFGGKANGDKIKRILLIAGAAVAFVGLATWGVASMHYAKIRSDRRDVLESDFQALRKQLQDIRDGIQTVNAAELDALVQQLTANYNQLNAQLSANEMNFLNNNGYVRMQCNSYSQASSIICNKYNYQVFTGVSTCTVMCYKNVVQGKETLHEAPICSSPYIPSDCFSQAMYTAEYNAGYNQGYQANYSVGQSDGRQDGTTEGQHNGHEDGDEDGYDDGYADGREDGDVVGYADGYEDGYNQRYNSGYEAGYNAGFDAGYDAGYSSVEFISKLAGTAQRSFNFLMSLISSNPNFKKGYDDGARDAQLLLSAQSTRSDSST